MQIVIEITDETYEYILNGSETSIDESNVVTAVRKGTLLPKGHGKIMDVDKIIKKMEEREEQLKDIRSIYETVCVETALDMFGETIIPADKDGELNG